MSPNDYILIGVILRVLGVITLVFYLIPKQVAEVSRPRSWLTRPRIVLLFALASIVTAVLPGSINQFLLYLGIKSQSLQNLSYITTNLSFDGLIFAFVYLYNYKRKE